MTVPRVAGGRHSAEIRRERRSSLQDSSLLIQPTPPTGSEIYPWVVVFLLWLVCFFSYADRQAFFSIFPLLQKQMNLTTVQLGVLGSSFAVVYGLGGPFAGYLVDRIRRKTAILGGLELWSVICVLSALSRDFFQLLIFRAAEGIGECIYYPAALSMISDYHGKRTRSRAMGILQTSVYAGTVGGGYWAGAIAQQHGWRAALFVFGGLGCLLGLLLIRLLREPVRGSADSTFNQDQLTCQPQPPAPLSLRAIPSLLKIKSLLTITAVFACANFVAMVLLAWMPMYLYSRFHLSLSMAAFDAAVYPQVASMGGSLCGGYLADRLARQTRRGRVAVQCAGVLIGVPFVILCGLGGSLTQVIVALICWGFFKGMYDSNIFASAFDVVPIESRGTVSGLMNCVGWLLGGGIAPALVGFLAVYISLGHAIAWSATFYALAGILLMLTMRYFLDNDIDRLQRPEFITNGSPHDCQT
ncbi:MAG TPA: MFS transporter [Acidobacteriaceae bacterium]|nr:MFS transporter [Acidobacteriaceae bacterium]